MIAQVLREFAALFVVTDPQAPAYRISDTARIRRWSLWLLACIVLAGAIVRFWGLGSVGLHGDEKTMALPVMSLINEGRPIMPSGMFYPRAVGQLYLMAASVMAFGQSEWAMRLPSALCGVLLILLAYQAGGRFLTPAWKLALAAAVAFLPDFIEDSQTARMYVFLVACVTGYMALVFAWERTGRSRYLVAAVITLLIGVQFHTLAIFAAFLVFMPGLVQGDARKFWAGAVAFVTIAVGFELINHLITLAYPQPADSDAGSADNGPHAAVVPHVKHLWLMLGAIPALAFSFWVVARRGMLAVLLLCAALVAEAALQWHAALLMGVAALVLGRRAGPLAGARLICLLAISVAIGTAQALFLLHQHAGTLKQIAGVMLGWPSVWSFISIGGYSEVALLGVVGSVGCGLWLLAHRRPMPDHLLLVVLGVWVPLLMIGWIKWNIPSRYAAAQIMPLLVAAFAAMQWLTQTLARRTATQVDAQGDVERDRGLVLASPGGVTAAWVPAAAVTAAILVVNPVQVAKAIDSGYANHPDHKGAAEFVAHLHPQAHDIIIAEDVLQQTYYLGHVDYWLVNKQVAASYMHWVRGRLLDFYTGTPLLGTGSDLEQVVEMPNRGAIYVIGSGENQEDGRSHLRGFGLAQVLQSPPFHCVYVGRDGVTRVWKVDASPPNVVMGQ
jgi:4-amino-4-deoxy-L-arabinose transferase-like glycosyltransferase